MQLQKLLRKLYLASSGRTVTPERFHSFQISLPSPVGCVAVGIHDDVEGQQGLHLDLLSFVEARRLRFCEKFNC